MIRVTRRAPVGRGAVAATGGGPVFGAETVARVRDLAPGLDPYALEAEWRAYWASTGKPRLTAPDRAYLAWVATRAARGHGSAGD